MVEFWSGYAWPLIWTVMMIVVIVVPLLLAVAYLTYAERKVIAAMQLRKGPNVVGPLGLLQPFADGLKLLLKETVIPGGANRVGEGSVGERRRRSTLARWKSSGATEKRSGSPPTSLCDTRRK